jgi:hypothetical protein
MPAILTSRILFGSFLVAALLASPQKFEPAFGVTEALAQVPSSARAGQRACSERSGLRSEHSREPTKLTFVNKSGMYRALMWIDFKGQFKDYGGMNSGQRKTIDTFRTHPWMITDGPGNCIQIIMPAAEPAIVSLK